MSQDLKAQHQMVESLYMEIVSDHVEPCLSRAEFRKRGKDWFLRWEGDCLWRLSCDLRKVRMRDEGWLCVAVCIGFRSLSQFLKPCPVVNVIDVAKPCAMATDLGHLRPPYQFLEWRLLPDTDVRTVGQTVVAEIEQHGLPYFEQYGTLDKALAAWESGTTYNLGLSADFYIAAAYWLRGEHQRAFDFIERKISQVEAKYKETGRREDRIFLQQRGAFLEFLKSEQKDAQAPHIGK